MQSISEKGNRKKKNLVLRYVYNIFYIIANFNNIAFRAIETNNNK